MSLCITQCRMYQRHQCKTDTEAAKEKHRHNTSYKRFPEKDTENIPEKPQMGFHETKISVQ